MRFADKLVKAIADARKSQSGLERETGIPQTAISAMTRGKRRPYLDQAYALARALGVSVDYLADEGQDDPSGSMLTEGERLILSAVRGMGVEEAMRRLTNAPAEKLPPGVEIPLMPAGPPQPVRRDSVPKSQDSHSGRKGRRRAGGD